MVLTIILTAALLIFLIGIAIRIARIAAMPVHVRWELYPMPDGPIGKMRVMISEIFLLQGVFRNHRSLWLWSWLFHFSLYLLIGAAGLSGLALLWRHASEGIVMLAAILSITAYACGAAGASGLMLIRLTSNRLRPFTSLATLFNLALLLAIFLSGITHAVLQPSAARIMVAQTGSILGLNPPPRLHPAAVVHLGFIAFFAAYFPFTQMAHAVLKYFMYHSVRWDDRPGHAKRISCYMAYPISWSAPHIQTGKGRTSWSEVVTPKDAIEKTDERSAGSE